MKTQFRQQLVKLIQRILASGPVSQDDLLAQLHQAGFRTDLGQLYLVCFEHGLAELQGTMGCRGPSMTPPGLSR
jgi:hypothetical protein